MMSYDVQRSPLLGDSKWRMERVQLHTQRLAACSGPPLSLPSGTDVYNNHLFTY